MSHPQRNQIDGVVFNADASREPIQPAVLTRESSYDFHKNIFRSNKFDELTRKNSARWLIQNGVQWDNGRAIDPERLPT